MSNKKASLADIIAKKRQGEMDRLQVKYYESETLGLEVEIRKIPLSKFIDLSDSGHDDENGESVRNHLDSMNRVLFEVCPMFKENTKEAMEVYGVATPTDLPMAVFEEQMNEMKDIMEIANSFYGIDKIDEKIKN